VTAAYAVAPWVPFQRGSTVVFQRFVTATDSRLPLFPFSAKPMPTSVAGFSLRSPEGTGSRCVTCAEGSADRRRGYSLGQGFVYQFGHMLWARVRKIENLMAATCA